MKHLECFSWLQISPRIETRENHTQYWPSTSGETTHFRNHPFPNKIGLSRLKYCSVFPKFLNKKERLCYWIKTHCALNHYTYVLDRKLFFVWKKKIVNLPKSTRSISCHHSMSDKANQINQSRKKISFILISASIFQKRSWWLMRRSNPSHLFSFDANSNEGVGKYVDYNDDNYFSFVWYSHDQIVAFWIELNCAN